MDGQLAVLCTSMEDNVSINSSDSVTTSGEYEIVPELIDCGVEPSGGSSLDAGAKPPTQSPKLAIFNNGDMAELAKNMHEVIHDMDDTFVGPQRHSSTQSVSGTDPSSVCLASDDPTMVVMGTQMPPTRIAGQGKFMYMFSIYSCV